MMSLNELRALCEAATPGPWKPISGWDDNEIYIPNPEDASLPSVALTSKDHKFIAAAREYMPKLITLVHAAYPELFGME